MTKIQVIHITYLMNLIKVQTKGDFLLRFPVCLS